MYICMKGVSMELRKKILDLNDMEMLLHSRQYICKANKEITKVL